MLVLTARFLQHFDHSFMLKTNMRLISSLLAFSFSIGSSLAQSLPEIYQDLELHYNDENFEACIKLEKDVELLAKTQRDTIVANSFFYVGDAHNQLGDINKAISWFEREKVLRAELGLMETDAFSGSLYNLAFLYMKAGNYNQASLMADQLISNDRKLYPPTSEEFIASVMSAVDIFIRLDKFNEAERLLQFTIRQQPESSIERGVLLSKLGDVYTITSQYSKAEKSLYPAIDIIQKTTGENSPEFITAAINLGILYMGQGKYADAEETFDYAISELTPDEPAYAATLNNQGLVYHSLGQLEMAEKNFLQIKSLDSAALGITHPDFAITLTNLGFVYCDEGKYAEAEKILERALEIQKHNGGERTASYAKKLNNLARVYRLAGTPEKAIPLHEQALKIYKKTLGTNSAENATSLYNAGIAYWKSGKEKVALKYLKNSASVRAEILGKNHPKYAESLQKIAEFHWHQKQLKEAKQIFGDVFNSYYYQMDAFFPVLTEDEKAKFYYTNIKPSFEKFNSFALDLHLQDPSILGDVFDHQLNTKASIMYATEKVKAAIQSSQDTVLIHEFELWQSMKEQVAKLYSQNLATHKMDSLQQSANRIEKELTKKSAVFATQFIKKKLSWKDIRKTLGENEAAIEVIRFNTYSPAAGGSFKDEIIYAFLIVTPETKDHPDIIIMNNGNDMETKFVNFYRNSIKFTVDDRRSYKNFLEDLGEYLGKHKIKKAFLSPDGVYNQISVNTIKNPATGKFFLDDFDIRLLTNTRELVENKTAKSKSQSSILMGYPKFNLQSSIETTVSSRSVTRGTNLTRGLRGGLLRYMRGEGGIAMLPGTRREISQIAKLSSHPEIFMEEVASEATIKQVANPMVLHVATHGYFLEDEAPELNAAELNTAYVPSPLLRSGIILAGAENFLKSGTPVNVAGDDGILTAYEVMNLNLDDTELVVLSACETGLGVLKNGEGVYGLQRAFKMAGAKSIIMSLWNVDDTATQELMSLFYAEKLTKNNLHEAFRAAQQKLKEKYSHPFYWGAFIIVGI